MPDLSPKAFSRLSRVVGTGSIGPQPNARRTVTGGEGPRPSPGPAYAELQVTSNFSFLRGASHPDELVTTAAKLGHRAIAITDRNSLAGVVRAHQAAETAGVRLVIGVRLDLRDSSSLLAYPEDRAAYGRLTRLLTLGKRRAPKGECHLDYADLVAHGEGQILIVLPPDDGDVAARAARVAADFAGRAYLAAHHLYRGDDAARLARLAAVSAHTGLPLVAVNDVLYHSPARRPLQDVVTCIREHCTIASAGFRLLANAERHLKPPAEMARLFRGYENALARTLEITERCRFNLKELQYEYPEEPVPAGKTAQQHLADLVWGSIGKRFSTGGSSNSEPYETYADHPRIKPEFTEEIRKKIKHELQLIEELNYARYFLTVHDIVAFATGEKILCQGRGSAANSLVCYCLGITSIGPDRIDALFERFISAARNEPPDIDVDFEHERREEVIQYIYRRYGRANAGLAATVVCYRSRGAIREVGKVLGLSGDTVAALAGIVWGWSNEGIADHRVREAGLDPDDPNLRLALTLAAELIGFPRHLSQHVGGFVITRGALEELVPIENAAMENRTVIEWDKDDLDVLHILKVDILALGMLTCIRKAFALISRHYDRTLELHTIPEERPEVYEMLGRADSIGVFQVESRAQMSMLPRLKPKEFYDLVIEVAIVRPGPIQGDMVHPYLRRRKNLEPVEYHRPELRKVLEKTLGVPLFQEQAMKIAIVGAGFSPDDADKLRRSMATFKRNGNVHEFREPFIAGMIKNGYPSDFASRCFSQIEGFGTYGFPESHAASFSLLVYVSAWVKCFHPDVFACALLNSQPMGFYAPAQIVADARKHGVEVRPPDVNFSDWDCTLEPSTPAAGAALLPCASPAQAGVHPAATPKPTNGPRSSPGGNFGDADEQALAAGEHRMALRLGLRQIKGFSDKDAKKLTEARGAGYHDADDLWRRSGLGRAALERLAAADALRSLALDRRRGLWALKALGEPPLPLFASGMNAISERPKEFVAVEPEEAALSGMPISIERCPWLPASESRNGNRSEALASSLLPVMPLGEHVVEDYATTGLTIKRHPLAFLRAELQQQGLVPAADLATLPVERRYRIAGLVLIRQRPGSANGVIFITIEDETGVTNLIVWPPVLERFRRAVLGATLLYCRGRLQREESVTHLVADDLRDWTPRLNTLRERTGDEKPPAENTPSFSPPQRIPGYDTRDLVIPSRDFH